MGPDLTIAARPASSPACRPTSTPCRLQLLRQHLWLDVLHGDRLPRRPCHHRVDLPDRLPDPRLSRPLHADAASRLRVLPPGTGTSSTWCGCSCSPASMSGARAPNAAAQPLAGTAKARALPRCGPLLRRDRHCFGAAHCARRTTPWRKTTVHCECRSLAALPAAVRAAARASFSPASCAPAALRALRARLFLCGCGRWAGLFVIFISGFIVVFAALTVEIALSAALLGACAVVGAADPDHDARSAAPGEGPADRAPISPQGRRGPPASGEAP